MSCAVEVLEDGNGDEDRGGSDEDGRGDEVGGGEVRGGEVRGGESGGSGDDDNGGEEDGLWARLAAVDWVNFDIISSCRFFFAPRFRSVTRWLMALLSSHSAAQQSSKA